MGAKTYHGLYGQCTNPGYSMKPGETHKLRMTKKNVDGRVQLQTYVDDKPHCSAIGQHTWLTRQGVTSKCEPVDQLRIDNWTEKPGSDSKFTRGCC